MKRFWKLSIALLLALVTLLTSCTPRNVPNPVLSETVTEAASTAESAPGSEERALPFLETGIKEINKYGNITLTVDPQAVLDRGFEPADVILVRIGRAEMEMPIGSAYSDVDSGEAVCCLKAGSDGSGGKVVLAINSGNLASAMKIAEIRSIEADPGFECVWAEGFDLSVKVTLSMVKKQGFAEEYAMHQLGNTRTNKRADYADLSDAEYANFRAVETTGMGKGILYRSSTPVDPSLNRNREADAQIALFGIRTVLNMTDQEETMRSFPGFSETHYAKCSVLALNMGMDFQTDDFREKLARGLRYMISHEAPYLIHCKEGKDRTGFAAALLEALMGANLDEITADYLLTYRIFYGIDPKTEQAEQIAQSNILTSLGKAFGADLIHGGTDVNLADCAENYLHGLGMSSEEIATLKNCLAGERS